jgi:undecaprenyl-diphosphatase
VMGLCLYAADRYGLKKKGMSSVTLLGSLGIGISQVLAIIPGVSRSGVTMASGMAAGLTREGAARFSFLLSTPVILGAALVKLPKLASDPSAMTLNFAVAVVVSSVAGALSIGFLLRYLTAGSFLPFVVYRMTLAALIIVVGLLH